jgi:NAD(P)-dependent dehydrogenase (short-subunit alcohol dehydrogenase family)
LGARFLDIASITGMVTKRYYAIKGTTMAAQVSLCESIIVAADTDVTTTATSTGYVDTKMIEWLQRSDRPRDDAPGRQHRRFGFRDRVTA